MHLAWLHILLALKPSPACPALCPCVVPPGVDYRSDSAMVRLTEAEAGAIFVGTVRAVDTVALDRSWFPKHTAIDRRIMERPDVVRYTFVVSEVWKGQVGERAQLTVRAFSSIAGGSSRTERNTSFTPCSGVGSSNPMPACAPD